MQDEGALVRNRAMLGKRVEILIEGISKTDPSRVTGRDFANRLVHCPGDASMAGRLAIVEIEEVGAHSFIGRRVSLEADGERWPVR